MGPKKWHHDCQTFGIQALWKPEKYTLQDLLLSWIIPRKLNFALSLRELSWISIWHNNTNLVYTNFYLIPERFLWFKIYKLLILKLVHATSFASVKTRAFVDTDLLLMKKMVAKSNTNFVTSSQDFCVKLIEIVIDLKSP